MSHSELVSVFEEWIEQGGDLETKLGEAGVAFDKIDEPSDAEAVCRAVGSARILDAEPADRIGAVRLLISCFQVVGTKAAFEVFRDEGLPPLRALLRKNLPELCDEPDVPLFIVKILAIYAQEEDASLILQTAATDWAAKEYIWPVIFDSIGPNEAGFLQIYEGLRSPLPAENTPLCAAYLDFANRVLRETDARPHPFDTEEGFARLQKYLTKSLPEDTEPEDAAIADGWAHSAAGALAFIEHSDADDLTNAAFHHRNIYVRMEAAWAMTMLGDPLGEEALLEWATEPATSRRAVAYLEELGAADELPYPCNEPDFQATAEMSDWLQHPQEFGRAPDSIEIYDQRTIHWPPTNDRRPLWLLKYTYEPTDGGEPVTGIGMVGSITFSLFGETTSEMTPEELYALHCCWELEATGDPRAPEERTVRAGLLMLAAQNSEFV
jgi:hypothetical protein